MENEISIHPLTATPTAAWEEISKTQKYKKVTLKTLKPVKDHLLRFVCMSDTHSLVDKIKFTIPDGDVFIHAGDFTYIGHRDEVTQFNRWIGTLPHKHKIVIAGNHELCFDETCANIYKTCFKPDLEKSEAEVLPQDKGATSANTENVRQLLTNCTYLEDSSVDICGIKIYGSPWQPEFGTWAFNLPRGAKCLEKWNLIPADTDILVTHGPALGHGDIARFGVRAGCVELLSTIQNRVKPKYHIFGHIHEGYGVTSDGSTIFINASTCDIKYKPVNLPVVFDMPLPAGQTK